MDIFAITMLCLLLLSNLETQQMQSQPLHRRQEEAAAELQHLLGLELPRKLRISEELPARENEDEEASASEAKPTSKEEQNNEMHGNGEWDEDEDDPVPVDHFTMDYSSSIKRRRPIHNMSSQHP